MNNRMKEVREYFKLSQREMAEKVGISTPYYSQIERGVKKEVFPGKLISGFAALGVDLNWLMTGEGKMMASPQTPLQDGEGLDANVTIQMPHSMRRNEQNSEVAQWTKNEDEAAEIRRWRKPVIEREDEEEKEAEAEQVRRGERIFRRDKRRARVSRVKCRGMMELDNRLSTRLVCLRRESRGLKEESTVSRRCCDDREV